MKQRSKQLLAGTLALLAVGALATGSVFAQTDTQPSTTSDTQHTFSMPSNPTVQIGPNGKTLLRGTVVSVGTDTVTVHSWGGTWTVTVPSSAQVLPKGVALSSFQAGDFVGVQGTADSTASWTVNATLIRDWTTKQTIQTNKQDIKTTHQTQGLHIFQGTLSALSGDTFTLTDASGTVYTVTLNTNATIYEKNYIKTDISQVQNGDSIRVQGILSGTAITGSILRDLSLPRA